MKNRNRSERGIKTCRRIAWLSLAILLVSGFRLPLQAQRYVLIDTPDVVAEPVAEPAAPKPERTSTDWKRAIFEVSYTASSFDDVKATGFYGLGFTLLPAELTPQLYGGFHCSPVNFNFGLVDRQMASTLVALGPAVGYYIRPGIFVTMPLDLLCNIYSVDDRTTTSWGMALAPSLRVGGRFGVFVGPYFSLGFASGSKVQCGFQAGLYF